MHDMNLLLSDTCSWGCVR